MTAAPGGAQITAIPSPLNAVAAAAVGSSSHGTTAAASSSSSSDVLTITRDDPPPLPAFPYPVAPASARSYTSARSGSPAPNSAGVGSGGSSSGRQVQQPQSARASQQFSSPFSPDNAARRGSFASPPQRQSTLVLPSSGSNSRRTSMQPSTSAAVHSDLNALLGTFSASNSSMMLGVAAMLRAGGGGTADETKVLCAECERDAATVRCNDCNNRNYCTSCNRSTHASRSMRTHTRVPLLQTGEPDLEHSTRSSTAASRPDTGSSSVSHQQQQQQSLSPSPPTSAPRPPSEPNTPRLVQPHSGGHGREISRASIGGSGAGMTPSPVPVSTVTSPTPASAPARPSPLHARASPADSDSSDDDLDAAGLASAVLASSLSPDAALCDQCHSSLAVVYCLECDSNLDIACNARIHKARTMAKHRQVQVERREEVLRQIEDASELAAQLEAAAADDDDDGRVRAAQLDDSPPASAAFSGSGLASYRGASSGRSLLSHSVPAAASKHLPGSSPSPRENRLASFIAPLGLGFGAGGGRSSMHGRSPGGSQVASNGSPVLSPSSATGSGLRGSLTIASQISPPSTGGGSRGRANSSAAASNLTPTHGASGMLLGRPPLTPSSGSLALGSFVPRPPSEDRARSSSSAAGPAAATGTSVGSRPGSSAGEIDLDSSFALGAAAFGAVVGGGDRSRSASRSTNPAPLLTPTPPGSSGGSAYRNGSGSSSSPAPSGSPLSAGMMGFAAGSYTSVSRASFASSSVASSPVGTAHHPSSSPPSTAGELRPATSSSSSGARPATGDPSAIMMMPDSDPAAPPSVLPVPPADSSEVDRKCDNCDEHLASVWCADCRMYLCTTEGTASCKQLIHRPAKMRDHVIHLIGLIPA